MRSLESYTQEEKNLKFEQLYNLAKDNYNHVKENGYEKKDVEYWCFEAIMDLLGKNIWMEYNKLL